MLIANHKSRFGRAAGPRLYTVLLTCFVINALLANLIHHHYGFSIIKDPLGASAFEAPPSGDSNSAPEAAGESNCLSCRLQRNLVSDSHAASVLFELPRGPLHPVSSRPDPSSPGASLLLSDRAPPIN
jgi:hypothetical protein